MQKIFLKFTLYTALVFLQPLFCEDFENIPKMTIRGEGVLIKPSDQVEVDLGVITHSENSSEAVNANNIKMRQIIENLKNIGLEE